MNIDFTKPIIFAEQTTECNIPHYRYCPKCGQRYVLYGSEDYDFITMLTIFGNSIVCVSCGAAGAGEPYNEEHQFNNQ